MVVLESSYDGIDEERTYYYTASWQVAEERIDRDDDGTDDERAQQFWGVRYIDDAVAKRQDRDGDGVWTTATLDNWYYLTDVMFSVRGIADREGNMHTRVDYTPYGVAMHRYALDVNHDGSINFNDLTPLSVMYNAGSPLEPGSVGYDPDVDLNGDGLAEDYSTVEQPAYLARFSAYSSGGSNPSPNTGWIDAPGDANGPDNSVGYDGYWFDVAGATDAGSTGLYAVRHRTYDPGLGRWIEKDPVGTGLQSAVSWLRFTEVIAAMSSRPYAGQRLARQISMRRIRPISQYNDGTNIYQYSISSPATLSDPSGLDLGVRGPDNAAKCKAIRDCKRAVDKGLEDRKWLDDLPDCPCSIVTEGQSVWILVDGWIRVGNPDNGIWENPSPDHIKGNHDGASLCMRSKPTSSGSGQQCCYDSQGLLITSGPAAGTPDRVSPGTNVLFHYILDVRPYKACKAAGMIDQYLRAWLPNNGNGCPSNRAGR